MSLPKVAFGFILVLFLLHITEAQNSCIEAGYTTCCISVIRNCHGSGPASCLCDAICSEFNDCCSDQSRICSIDDNPYSNPNSTFLVYADNRYISKEAFGPGTQRLVEVSSGGAFALDVDIARNFVYYSDNVMNTISRADLVVGGGKVIQIADTGMNAVGDIAVDWIGNNLYWTESRNQRIVVMDLDSMYTATLLKARPSETFKAIVVDPNRSLMFWSTWGNPSSIQSGLMNGSNVVTLHSQGLVHPNDITLDIPRQKLYWTDGMVGVIQFSDYNGNNKGDFVQVPSSYLFGITLDSYVVFFGDWDANTISYAHKLDPDSPALIIKSNLTAIVDGMELVSPDKQAPGTNPCTAATCSQLCVLSSDPGGYSCLCSDGFTFDASGRNCTENFVTVVPPPEVTCKGTFSLTSCCTTGVCDSYSCFCDSRCHYRGDCCSDIEAVCPSQMSSCMDAGYSVCCEEGSCEGLSYGTGNCFCDSQCRNFSNCCDDIDRTCPEGTGTTPPSRNELQFIQLNTSTGVNTEAVGHFDDGVSSAIHIPNGFPFDGTIHSILYIGTNGIISFDQPVYSSVSTRFPSSRNDIRNLFIIAPYWDDIDIRQTGAILYERHSTTSGNAASIQLITNVSTFVQGETGTDFVGNWMLVVQWDRVHPWPHGDLSDNPFLAIIFPDAIEMNTLQAVLITNGTHSYTIFTYECGSIGWSFFTVIGYNAAGRIFENHPFSGSLANQIACANFPASNWTNVLYDLSTGFVNITDPPTVEPSQNAYLPRLDFFNLTNSQSGSLSPCRNCSSGLINLGAPGIPFGYYYHQSLYVGVNGIISFDREFSLNSPENFPSTDGKVFYSYLVAPYWSDIDTRREGRVRYESYYLGDSIASDRQLNTVNDFIQTEEDSDFQGNWMMLASWEDVHPFPHGDIANFDRVDPYLELTNSFQAVIVTNSTKTYAIFTYYCDDMGWSDEATIGFNAASDFFENHPLGGELHANTIGCVHLLHGVILNNVIYDLVPLGVNSTTPPPPPSSLGSCVQSGYSDCCTTGNCLGTPADCMCDEFCHLSNDCCEDIYSTCNRDLPPDNDTYLIFANRPFLNRVNVNGDYFHIISQHIGQIIIGIDYDYRNGFIYWSDVSTDQIYRSNFNGLSVEILANATHEDIEDIALDWIGNNLYWTESITGNIEVLDLDTLERAVVVNTGPETIPRGIAVDPSTREIFWTDWGSLAKIEKSSMDGTNRQTLHNTSLIWPNGVTLDYPAQRVYWVDAFLDRIEYSNYDGTNRIVLIRQLLHPFALTIEGNLVFWTDWANNSVFAAHKTAALGVQVVRDFLRDRPYGIEAVTPTRQAIVPNPCLNSDCSHICLLSSSRAEGYKCVCPRGYELLQDGVTCMDLNTIRPPTVIGSCAAAGYNQCCSSLLLFQFCVGSDPFNCYCDLGCIDRSDCCSDFSSVCTTIGSCRSAGYQGCCNPRYSSCAGNGGSCHCDSICVIFGDCCSDFREVCTDGLPGSCAAAGYTTCCESGECFGQDPNCKCDADCRTRGDCCLDIDNTCSTSIITTTPMANTSTEFTSVATPSTTPFTTPSTTPTGTPPVPQQIWLPFINLTQTVGVQTFYLPRVDDGSSAPITIPEQFPFRSSLQSTAFVNTNGIISFALPFTYHSPFLFPSFFSIVRNAYLLAPFWSDVDNSIDGEILYEVHTRQSRNEGSRVILSTVSAFISNYTESEFNGVWMLVAEWNGVHPYSGPLNLSNTYQALAITDNYKSYAIFTYKCGLMEWSSSATIGFNDYGNHFFNHPLSGSDDAQTIACLNLPLTPWSNVVLNLTGTVVPTPLPPLPQSLNGYLPFLEPTGVDVSGDLEPCDMCSSGAINISTTPFPFGNYYHSVVYVNTDGVISFTSDFPYNQPTLFPGLTLASFSFAVAPFWANIDTRPQGRVHYEIHKQGEVAASNELLEMVSVFINNQTNISSFEGTWMLVATWNGVQSFLGSDGNFTSSSVNTFQSITITNGTQSYAIFTYQCDLIQWSGDATIGFNAGGDYHANHPYSGTINTVDIDCLNSPGSIWYNVMYDLVPGGVPDSYNLPTPPYGSCSRAGFDGCCFDNDLLACRGSFPSDCFCDPICIRFGDCCSDFKELCSSVQLNDTHYLLVSTSRAIVRLDIEGNGIEYLYGRTSGFTNIVALDYDYQRGFIYFSDVHLNTVSKMSLDGSNLTVLVNSGVFVVDGLAVDWIANNLYWTDAFYRRLEVLDLDTMQRKELIRFGPFTIPRAIEVDPATRYMYWTDWGSPAKIERASMDGSSRQLLHSTGLVWPNGLTIDYATQQIFWGDALLDRIEYSNVDGSGRRVLTSSLGGVNPHLFDITLESNVLYWTDWSTLSVLGTHKVSGDFVITVFENFTSRPDGIKAVSPFQQAIVPNPCEDNSCSHLCLLSNVNPNQYICACPDNAILSSNGQDCEGSNTTSLPPTPIINGSCVAAGYITCCTAGLCLGFPPNCYCDTFCSFLEDCCSDLEDICSTIPTVVVSTPLVRLSSTMTGVQVTPTRTVGVISSSIAFKPSSTPHPSQLLATSTPHPSQLSSTPSPSQLSSTPRPPQPSSTLSPSQLSSTPRLFKPSSTPRPPQPSSTPSQSQLSSTPRAPQPSSTPHPPQVSSTPRLPQQSPTSLPPLKSSTSFPPEQSPTPLLSPTPYQTQQSLVALPTATPTPPITTAPPISVPEFGPNLNVAVLNERELLVSWTALPDANSYHLEVRNYSGDIVLARNVDDSGVNFSISVDVGPYIPYNVTVYGMNSAGAGPSTNKFYIFTAETVPFAPRGVSGTRIKDDTFEIMWMKLTPDRARGVITNYTISYKKEVEGKSKRQTDAAERGLKVVSGNESRAVIGGLDVGASYSVVMWANTTAGKGMESIPIIIKPITIDTPKPHSGVNSGVIVGPVFGVLFLLALAIVIVFIVLWVMRRRNKVKNTSYALFGHDETEESSTHADEQEDKDQVVTTSFKQTDLPVSLNNPLYEVTGGSGMPSVSNSDVQEPDEEMKDDLAKLPLYDYIKDDIDL